MSVSVPPEAKKHLGEANLLYMAGNYQGATTLLLEVVRICPRLPHPYDTLGVIYEIEGKKKKALQLFLMAATLSKRDEGHWRRLASLATEVGESEQALFCLGKLLALAPDDEDALWEQAQLHVQLGHHRKASSVLASLLHSRPGNVEVAHHLARCYVELGMRDRAIDMLGLALASVRGDSPAEAAVGGGEGGAPPHRPDQAPSRSVAPSPATSSPPVAGGSAQQPDSPPGAPVPALSVETLECALHLTNMLVELLIEKGAYKEALARLLQLRALGWPDLPLEICVKQGVCHAYLGQLADADRLWQPLLDSLPPAAAETGDAGSSADHAAAGLSAQAKPDPATCAALMPYATAGGAGGGSALRLHETDYLLYEIAKVFLALALPHRALRIYDALLGSERYAPIVHLRRGECLDALRRAAEAADAYSEALAVNASSLEALLAACNLHLRQGQPAHVLALQLSHGCINTAAAGPVVAAGVQVSGAGGVGTGTRARWEGSLSGESTDPRLVALRGCAWSDLGRHAEAVALLLPMQRACLVLMRPKPHRGKRDQADALGAGLEPPRKQLRMSASGEIVVDTGDGEGDGDGFRPATGFACGGHDGGSSEAEETDAWGGAQGDLTATEEELAAVQAAAGDGAAAARRLSQRARSILHPLGSDELWFTLTERLTHSLWVTRGPTEAYEQLQRATEMFMLPAKAPQPRAQLDPNRLILLRMLLAKLATTLGDPLRAYDYLRNQCRDAADDASLWTLFNCISSRTLINRPDDRWTLRSLIRHPDAAHITLAVAHRCLMARSFPIAMGEYITLYTANPQEPLLPLCIGLCMLQTATNRKNQNKGHSAVVAMSWLEVYAELRSAAHVQEVAYNTGRAYHHLGLKHLATAYYVQALLLGERGSDNAPAGSCGRTVADDAQNLTMEAARNLACICRDTGDTAFAEQIVRTFMTV